MPDAFFNALRPETTRQEYGYHDGCKTTVAFSFAADWGRKPSTLPSSIFPFSFLHSIFDEDKAKKD